MQKSKLSKDKIISLTKQLIISAQAKAIIIIILTTWQYLFILNLIRNYVSKVLNNKIKILNLIFLNYVLYIYYILTIYLLRYIKVSNKCIYFEYMQQK